MFCFTNIWLAYHFSGTPFFKPKCPPPSAANFFLESQLLFLTQCMPQFPHLQIFVGHWPSLPQVDRGQRGTKSDSHPCLCVRSAFSPFHPLFLEARRQLVLMCTKTEHIQSHPEPLSPPLTIRDLPPCPQEHPPSVSPHFQGARSKTVNSH